MRGVAHGLGRDSKGHERKDESVAEVTEEYEEELTPERADENDQFEVHRDRLELC